MFQNKSQLLACSEGKTTLCSIDSDHEDTLIFLLDLPRKFNGSSVYLTESLHNFEFGINPLK